MRQQMKTKQARICYNTNLFPMKTTIIILILVAGLVLVAQAAFPPVEQQTYICHKKEGKFEIRTYPPALLATVRTKGTSYGETASPSFRRLANFIFGGNQQNQKIAMTAPVHMEFSDDGSKMSFVMPAGFDENNLPLPNDPGVVISKSQEKKVVSLRFGGFASDKKIQQKTRELLAYMSLNNLQIKGKPEYLGYNSPFRIIGRRNEIIAEIL
jgi:hypothetical protein